MCQPLSKNGEILSWIQDQDKGEANEAFCGHKLSRDAKKLGNEDKQCLNTIFKKSKGTKSMMNKISKC